MRVLILVAMLMIAVPVVHAQETAKGANTQQGAAMTAGEVRKVDKEQGKVTIRHEPLANLDMPAMTMVFRVKDPAMLEQVKEGDKIRFVADRVDGSLTIVGWQKNK